MTRFGLGGGRQQAHAARSFRIGRGSGVGAGLVLGVGGRLELERGVGQRHREVPGDALLQRVEHARVPRRSRKQAASTTTCADSTGREDDTRVTCRSWTASTCSCSQQVRCGRPPGRVRAAPTRAARRPRRAAAGGSAGTMSAPTSSAATPSARVQPVRAITRPARSTPIEPSASFSTSSSAARAVHVRAAGAAEHAERDEVADEADRAEHAAARGRARRRARRTAGSPR